MTEYLNQIFYKNNKFDSEPSIKLLQKFVLTNRAIENILKQSPIEQISKVNTEPQSQPESIKPESIKPESIKPESIKPESSKAKVISPDKKDSLFWCLYIAKHGYGEYIEIEKHYGNIEMQEKQKIIDYLRKYPTKVKNTNQKISKTVVQEIMSDLLINKTTSIQTVISMCMFYNLHVFIINGKTYIELIGDKDSETRTTCVIYRNEKKNFELESEEKVDVEKIRETMVEIENTDKPMKGVSSYKVEELENIAKKMGIFDYTKKYKKPDLYKEIWEKSVWV